MNYIILELRIRSISLSRRKKVLRGRTLHKLRYLTRQERSAKVCSVKSMKIFSLNKLK